MNIGTTLFARLATDGFSRIQSQITGLQERIAAGTEDPRPSADPVRAMKLSAGAELQTRLDRFARNAEAAETRLGVTDSVLGTVSDAVRQLRDLTMRANSATITEEGAEAIAIEASQLRESLLGAANRRDATGQPLFSGYGAGDAFADTGDGVEFIGDAGRSSLRVSETQSVATSLNGAEVFSTGAGGESLFDLVDGMIASLTTALRGGRDEVTSTTGSAKLTFPTTTEEITFSFRLEGPAGAVDISADLVAGVPGPMIDAINAGTAETGISAALAADGSITLSSSGTIQIGAGARGDAVMEPALSLQPLAADGTPSGNLQALRPATLTSESLLAGFAEAIDHLSTQRAEAGALASVASQQSEVLATRKVQVTENMTNLEELDIAAAVTRLQTLLTTQEAAQQSFVRIRSSSLFDYLS